MKRAVLILLVLVVFPSMGSGKEDPLATVAQVDLERYVGLWYEIAKIPNRFQKKCVSGTTAQYTIRDDGKIDVVNSCIMRDGDKNVAQGIAKIADTKSNSKLKVSFVRAFGISLFWGDYWIIGLGEDYEYAIVGEPKRKYGWILSRTPSMDHETLDELFRIIRDRGYDPGDFEITVH